MRKYILITTFMAFVLSCKKEQKTEGYQSRFVVEGSIEQDGYANISITHNLPFYTRLDSAQVEEIIIKYAKVTVSDGQEEEVLTGSYDRKLFPYFFYKGSSLKGRAGHHYQLKIEYASNTLTAETMVPERKTLDSIWFEKRDGMDRQLCIRFTDKPNEKNYYKIYTKLEKDPAFTRTLLSNQDDRYFDGKTLDLKLNRGAYNNLSGEYDPYFVLGDVAGLKFSTLPKSGFDFWEGFQNELLNAGNPLMGSTTPLKSNIVGNGIGIWCGYGSTIYRVTAK